MIPQNPSTLSCLGNGHPRPAETARHLKAGPLEVDLIEGELRYFNVGGDAEAVRRIYAAVRDASWNTVPGVRTGFKVDETGDGFQAEWNSHHMDGEVDFTWASRVTGTGDGVITWEFDGVANRDFAKNRVGFCVLHPLAVCLGQTCEVEHVSGDTAVRRFPDLIAPDQPVRGLHDFRRMRYAVSPSWEVEIGFTGDVFEMEDQRNWTDASFKTYSTPQRIPLPAKLREGQRVRQTVTVRLIAKQAGGAPGGDGSCIRVELGRNPALPLPKIGLGLPSHGGLMTDAEVKRLKALPLDHLRVDVRTSAADWRATLASGASEAARIGCGLEVALHLDRPGVAGMVEAERVSLEAPVARWLVIEEGKPVVSRPILEEARRVLGQGVGAGTDIDFFPLNNNRPAADQADFIFCAIRPQAHNFDDAAVVENLEGQTHVVAAARHLFAPLPFVASPVTLRRRWVKGPARPAEELPPMVDPRQMSLLGAGWLAGSLRALGEAGAMSVTWFETTGWRGMMEVEGGSALPDQFASVPGGVFPVYHVLRAVADFRQGGMRQVELSHPLRVQAVVLEAGSRQRWTVANVTAGPVKVVLPVGGVLRRLDTEAALRNALEPEDFWEQSGTLVAAGTLELGGWELVFLDVG